LLPLAKAFLETSIVVRPHLTESNGVYNKIASRCKQVYVTSEVDVVLMGTKSLIRNGCATGKCVVFAATA